MRAWRVIILTSDVIRHDNFNQDRKMCDRINFSYLEDQIGKLEKVTSVLEVGSRDVNGTTREFFLGRQCDYLGVDIAPGKGVDAVVDITGDIQTIRTMTRAVDYDLVVCMNVLEHVYEPIKALTNMLSLLRKGGYLMVVVPIVWDLHEYPYDFYRLNPDFFKKFAELSGISILKDSFLLSTRDDGMFYEDVNALPQVIHKKHKKGMMKRFLKLVHTHLVPGLYDCWPHVALNVIFRKS
jgi:SAM-dependent methyltransferase